MKNLQALFFQYLGTVLPQNQTLANEIANTLHISADGAYRRLRGETNVTLEELVAICKKYTISLDAIMGLQTGHVSFEATDLNNMPEDFEAYLQQMHTLISTAEQYEQKKMYYLCKDITFFHFFLNPGLAAFKTFFWNKTIYGLPEYRHEQFSFKSFPFKKIYLLGQQIIAEYNKIPSVEMWHEESLNSTLQQIAYYRDSGYFKNDNEVHLVLDALQSCLAHIQHELELGYKFMPGNAGKEKGAVLQVHVNEIVIGNNIIQLELNDTRQSFINYGVLGYLHTRDERINNRIMEDFNTLLDRSFQISNMGEKQRQHYFNRLKNRIDSIRPGKKIAKTTTQNKKNL